MEICCHLMDATNVGHPVKKNALLVLKEGIVIYVKMVLYCLKKMVDAFPIVEMEQLKDMKNAMMLCLLKLLAENVVLNLLIIALYLNMDFVNNVNQDLDCQTINATKYVKMLQRLEKRNKLTIHIPYLSTLIDYVKIQIKAVSIKSLAVYMNVQVIVLIANQENVLSVMNVKGIT